MITDFLGRKIPIVAFTRKCYGSGGRPQPVMLGLFVLRYCCPYCGQRFSRAEVKAATTPEHEARPVKLN